MICWTRSRAASEYGFTMEFMPARRPADTSSTATPSFSKAPPRASLPPSTPIDPVSVPGCATITSAGIAT